MDTSSKISQFIDVFDNIKNQTEDFLTVENNGLNSTKILVKELYDFVKSIEYSRNKKFSGKALPELIIKDFDEEQIWQEIELQNNDKIDKFTSNVNKLLSKKDDLSFPIQSETQLDGDSGEGSDSGHKNVVKHKKRVKVSKTSINDDDEDEDEEGLYDEENIDSEDELLSEQENIKGKNNKYKPSIVDDNFFKLSEMEEFLLTEEKREEKEDDKLGFGIDLFGQVPSDSIDNEDDFNTRYKYKDFFAEPRSNDTKEGKKFKKLNIDDEEILSDLEESVNEEDEVEEEEISESDGKDDVDDVNDGSEDSEDVDEESLNKKMSEIKEGDSDEIDSGLENEKDLDDNHKRKVRFDLSGDEESGSEDDPGGSTSGMEDEQEEKNNDSDIVKSTLEKRNERLTNHIKKLEEEALSEKPWQMKGEIGAAARPQNSLLEEILEFDVTSRPAPVMTEAVSERLEDIILRRIKDKAWDDVERKLKPVETVNEFKKRLVLDQEKSKLSLAQIYEQEYIKQRDAAASVGLKTEDKEPEELPEHKEIKSLMVSLFAKLNALANFHYTPAPAIPDVKIVSNLPAVTVEEVAPIATSDAALLAPEEVMGKKAKELMSKEERTDTDKKRERRKKKQFQKIKRKRNEAKELLKQNTNKNYSLEKATSDLTKLSYSRGVKVDTNVNNKVIKTSSAFFSNLQDKVKSQQNGVVKRKKKDENLINAKKLKL